MLVVHVVGSGTNCHSTSSHTSKVLRIVAAAGVVQASFYNAPPELVANNINMCIVALRLSDDNFRDRSLHDTGKRVLDVTAD